MPFFSNVAVVAATGVGVPILDLAPGVVLKSLTIKVHSAVAGAVVYVGPHPEPAGRGYPLAMNSYYNGVTASPCGGQSVRFNTEELRTLIKEEKRLYATGDGANACTVHVFGVMEY